MGPARAGDIDRLLQVRRSAATASSVTLSNCMKLSRDLFVLSSAVRTSLRLAFCFAVNVTLLELAAARRHAAVDTDQKAAAPAAID